MIGHSQRVSDRLRPRSGALRRVPLALVLTIGMLACSDDQSSTGDGPGPDEPPGPAEPAGPSEPVGSIQVAGDAVVGSGQLVTETRAVDAFDGVRLAGEGAITIVTGDTAQVTVETDDNLIELITTTVRDEVLEIDTTSGVDIAPSDSVRYTVTAPSVVSLAITGAGSIDIDQWSTQSPIIELTGAGEISVDAIDCDLLDVRHGGVGTITVAGSAREQRIVMTGAGEYDTSDLQSTTATVDVGGASTATLWVTDTLDIEASGTGTVSYFGAPDVTQQVDDLASVTPLGER